MFALQNHYGMLDGGHCKYYVSVSAFFVALLLLVCISILVSVPQYKSLVSLNTIAGAQPRLKS